MTGDWRRWWWQGFKMLCKAGPVSSFFPLEEGKVKSMVHDALGAAAV